MQLPWRQGYSWQPNGAHSNTGSGYPYSSFDASYDWPRWGSATYSVVAAHAGTVRVLSRCQVRVTHPSGWATNYYHMDQIQVSNGQQVSADTKLGVYAGNINTALCEGGSSTGPHLHFSLLYNGAFVSLQGASFGPYRINVGTSNYDNDCRRYYFYTTRAPAPPIALSVLCTQPRPGALSRRGARLQPGSAASETGAEQLARRCRRARRQAGPRGPACSAAPGQQGVGVARPHPLP